MTELLGATRASSDQPEATAGERGGGGRVILRRARPGRGGGTRRRVGGWRGAGAGRRDAMESMEQGGGSAVFVAPPLDQSVGPDPVGRGGRYFRSLGFAIPRSLVVFPRAFWLVLWLLLLLGRPADGRGARRRRRREGQRRKSWSLFIGTPLPDPPGRAWKGKQAHRTAPNKNTGKTYYTQNIQKQPEIRTATS